MSGSISDPNATPMAGLLDPTTAMLLGASQGFGQAAMPSRMPVPFGAALGMAAGGVAQGARDAQAMQLQQQQIQAARLNNQLAQSSMPARIALLNGATGGGSAPFGAPSSAGGGQSAQGAASGGASPGGGGFVMNPSDYMRRGDLALALGNDRAASALYGNGQTMVGGAGYGATPGGGSSFVPGGPADPANIFAREQALKSAGVAPALAEYIAKSNVDLQKNYYEYRDLGNGMSGPASSLVGPAPQIGGASAPSSAVPFPALAARINGAENATGNPGAKNPQSSATGNGQFIDGTWPSVIRATRPDLAAGKTDAQLMALRDDPDLAAQATTKYARQNAATLAQAGLPVSAGTVYLAHTLGPNGAISVLRAAPQTPMALLAPADVIARNPQMQNGQTAGGLRRWAEQRMAGPAAAAVPAQGGPAAASAPVAPGIARTTLPGGAVQTTNTRPLQEEQYRNDMKASDAATDDINHAQQQQARLLAMKDLVSKLPTGANGEARTAIANYVKTYMPALADTWMSKAASLPDAALAQEFQKFGLVGAGADERGVLGGRGSLGAINLFKQANPGMNLQSGANNSIINMQLVAHQADVDYARGLQQFVNNSGQNYVSGKDNYHPSSEYDQQWTAQHNPQVYAAAMSALNGEPFQKWSKFLQNKEEGLRTMRLIGRIDPTATVMNEHKQAMPVTAFLPQPAAP